MCLSQSCLTLCNPMDYIFHQAPLSIEFSRQEYWSGLPFPSSWDLPDLGIEPWSLALYWLLFLVLYHQIPFQQANSSVLTAISLQSVFLCYSLAKVMSELSTCDLKGATASIKNKNMNSLTET